MSHDPTRHCRLLSLVLLLGCITSSVAAQQPASNPVVSAARQMMSSRQKNMVAAAEAMPESKYGFQPTPKQATFGHLIEHITEANHLFCSRLSGDTKPPAQRATEKEGKAKLVAALNGSFDYCSTALGKVEDARLGDEVELFGGKKGSKATALLSLTGSWADHYATEAMYLRLSGLLPPSAKEK